MRSRNSWTLDPAPGGRGGPVVGNRSHIQVLHLDFSWIVHPIREDAHQARGRRAVVPSGSG